MASLSGKEERTAEGFCAPLIYFLEVEKRSKKVILLLVLFSSFGFLFYFQIRGVCFRESNVRNFSAWRERRGGISRGGSGKKEEEEEESRDGSKRPFFSSSSLLIHSPFSIPRGWPEKKSRERKTKKRRRFVSGYIDSTCSQLCSL